jgi:hypothetical protein
MEWLQQLLARLDGNNQVFILRRSAGFAYSILALLRAEPAGAKPTLLPLAMLTLQKQVERGLLPESVRRAEGTETAIEAFPDLLEGSNIEQWRMSVHALVSYESRYSFRHLCGWLPKNLLDDNLVIAINMINFEQNVLRLVIMDSTLASDLDAYVARSLELAVRGFGSSKWAVRNSSMMLFASVIQRAVDNDKVRLYSPFF